MMILNVNNLKISFKTLNGSVIVVNGVSFKVNKSEVVGIIGESGSGKSQTVLSLMGLLSQNSQVSGLAQFAGQNILSLTPNELNQIRGNKIAMIFQDPMTSLNPYLKISMQLVEVLIAHKGMAKADALKAAINMLDFVKIRDAKNTIQYYPHELSGGMRQRVMIAMALLCKPSLIIADEPTTALDVTVQAQILQIFKELRNEFATSIIMITHDMGVVANICDYVNVMHQGKIIESGQVDNIFLSPKAEHTRNLIAQQLK